MTTSNPPECFLLTRLPAELRLHIYEYILAFDRPLKLRQVVAGSKNTSILRANRQIYNEALPVHYDLNIIQVTRNDFCQDTDPELQTPLRRDRVRHLLIRNFSQSIRCSSFSGGNNLYLDGCCDVCKPDAAGFIIVLSRLPKLQSVVIDYHNHRREFDFIRSSAHGPKAVLGKGWPGFWLKAVDIARFKLTSPKIPPALDITFADIPFHNIWTELAARKAPDPSPFAFPNEEEVLQRLREEEHRELTDKLNYVFCLRHASLPGRIHEWTSWQAMDMAKAEGRDASSFIEDITWGVRAYISTVSVFTCTESLKNLRDYEREHAGREEAVYSGEPVALVELADGDD